VFNASYEVDSGAAKLVRFCGSGCIDGAFASAHRREHGNHAVFVEAQKRTALPADYGSTASSRSRPEELPVGGEARRAKGSAWAEAAPAVQRVKDLEDARCKPKHGARHQPDDPQQPKKLEHHALNVAWADRRDQT
jgi:hypothetical protein